MKRTAGAVVAAAVASTSIWLATAPAYAKMTPTARLVAAPQWTYLNGGKFAITATCSERKDLRIVFSRLLYRPVVVPGAGRLLMRVTGKTRAGKYSIGLECVRSNGQVDAVAFTTLTVRKRLSGWPTGSPPALPPHFKPDLTVQTSVRQVIVAKPPHRSSGRPTYS
jgi:hypothetical protein